MSLEEKKTKKLIYFVVLLGIVSLFSDITYEGARSINGQFLGLLGASAIVVGFVSGLGEFLGYALRILSGYLSDKTKNYWFFTFIGYFMNLFAVPLLAFVGNYKEAVTLILIERIGKAIRSPSRDTLISFAGKRMGQGLAFGFHEALDQIGATLGPVIVALAIVSKNDIRFGYAILLIPAILAIIFLFLARLTFTEKDFDSGIQEGETIKSKNFYIFTLFCSLLAVSTIDYPLMAFHFQKESIFKEVTIPILYSVAMVFDAIISLIFGYFFEKNRYKVFLFGVIFSFLSTPLIFISGSFITLIGVIFWGMSMGFQESVLKASITYFVPEKNRGKVFGIFQSIYGFFWFIGSFITGYLYTISPFYLIIFASLISLISFMGFVIFRKVFFD